MDPSKVLSILFSYGYEGGPVHFLDDDTVGFVVGNALKLLNLEDLKETFMWGFGVGISCFAPCPRFHYLAYAAKGNRPKIHVLTYPDMTPVVALQNGTLLEFAALAFSRDGQRVASLGRAPDFTLAVWDWGKELVLVQTSVGPENAADYLSFNPRDPDDLCLSGQGRISFWKVEKSFDFYAIANATGKGIFMEDSDAVEETTAWQTTHSWDANHGVYAVCDTGHLIHYTPWKDFEAKGGFRALKNRSWTVPGKVLDSSVEAAGPVTSVAVLRGKVAVAGADGVLRVFDEGTGEMAGMVKVCPRAPADGAERGAPNGAAIATIAINPAYTRMVVGTSDGALFHLGLRPEIESIEVAEVSRYHKGTVHCMARFPQQHILATAGEDGTVRFWAYAAARRAVGVVKLGRPVRCAHVSRHGLAAACTSEGVVHVLDCSILTSGSVGSPRLIWRSKLHDGPVRFAAFNPEGTVLTTAGDDERLFFVRTPTHRESKGAFSVVGYLPLRGQPTGLAWHTVADGEEPKIFVGCTGGDVYRVEAPRGDVASQSFKLAAQGAGGSDGMGVAQSLVHTDQPFSSIAMVPRVGTRSQQRMYALSSDRTLKVYTVPDIANDPDYADDHDVVVAEEEYQGHFKAGGALAVSPDGKWLVSGCTDGFLMLRPVMNLTTAAPLQQHDPRINGVVCLEFSYDSRYLFSAGTDGIFVYTLSYQGWQRVDEVALQIVPDISSMETIEIPDPEEMDGELSVIAAEEKAVKEAEDAIHEAARERMRKMVAGIKSRFDELLAQNKAAPKELQLEREEFVIDEEDRARRRAAGDAAAQAAKEAIELENVGREYVIEILRRDCWDAMEEQGASLLSFEGPGTITVTSYPIRKESEREKEIVKKVTTLRRLEEVSARALHAQATKRAASSAATGPGMRKPRHHRHHQTAANAASAASAASAAASGNVPNAGNRPGSQSSARRTPDGNQVEGAEGGKLNSPVAPKGRRRRRSSLFATTETVAVTGVVSSDSSEDEGEELRADELIFDQFALYMPQRKRTQIILLTNLITQRKREFNDEFRRVLKAKEAEIHKIEERNERIDAILAELKVMPDEPVMRPKLSDEELPERVLEVRDDEVPVDKYISPAELERRERERAEQEEKLKREKGDGAGERALMMMMGGRLHDGDAGGLDEELVRPEWMNKPASELTEEQVKQIKEFEKREKAVKEEREKHRRALETELKKLQNAVANQCETFDGELKRLFEAKLETDQEIYEAELRILAYAQALMQDEILRKKEKEAAQEVAALEARMHALTTEAAGFQQDVENARDRAAHALAEDKRLDRDFRRQLHDQFEQYREPLYRLYRRRIKGQKAAAYAAGDASAASLDPLLGHDDELLDQTVASMPTEYQLSYENDAPEGLSRDAWDQVMEARALKLRSEREKDQAAAMAADMQKYLNVLLAEKADTEALCEDKREELEEMQRGRKMASMNLDILQKLKQGYVETEEGSWRTVGQTLSLGGQRSHIMININDVHRENQEIQARGARKMKLLQDITACNSKLHHLDWEMQKLDLQAEEIQDSIRDFQLLRVTKKLQELIKSGAGSGKDGGAAGKGDRRAQETAMYERRLDYSSQSHQTKLEEKQRHLKKLRKLIAEKEAENAGLDERLAEIDASVSERSKIHKIQVQRATQHGPEKKLRQIAKRRKMVEVARAQAEEIAVLRDELERLRMKTFATFKEPAGVAPGPSRLSGSRGSYRG